VARRRPLIPRDAYLDRRHARALKQPQPRAGSRSPRPSATGPDTHRARPKLRLGHDGPDRYGWYRCGFAAHKGPAVCAHATWYRQVLLEQALLDRFRQAMTPPMVDTLARAINAHVVAAIHARGARADQRKAEILRLEREAGNLVLFLAQGGASQTVREELHAIETVLQGLRVELAAQTQAPAEPPEVQPMWVRAQLERLDGCSARIPSARGWSLRSTWTATWCSRRSRPSSASGAPKCADG
jgi:hypothetical protein